VAYSKGFGKNQWKLRGLFPLKNVIVAFGWGILPFFGASIAQNYPLSIYVISIYFASIVFVGSLIDDINDINIDKQSIVTLPIRYGISRCIKFARILLIFSTLLFILFFIIGRIPLYFILVVIAPLYFVNPMRKQLYSIKSKK